MFLFSFLKLGFDFIAGRAIALFNMRMQIATFIIDRWRICLVVAILCLSLLYVHSLRNQRDVAIKQNIATKTAYDAHLKADADANLKRDAENKASAEQGKKDTELLTAKHAQDLAQILIYSKQKEAKNAKDKDTTIKLALDSLRSNIEHQAATIRLPQNDTNRLASGNSDPTVSRQISEIEAELEVCQEGGAVCASDYNYCKDYVYREQKRLGVEK